MLNMSNTNHVNVTEDIWTKLYLKFKNLTDPPDQIPHKNSLHFLLESSTLYLYSVLLLVAALSYLGNVYFSSNTLHLVFLPQFSAGLFRVYKICHVNTLCS